MKHLSSRFSLSEHVVPSFGSAVRPSQLPLSGHRDGVQLEISRRKRFALWWTGGSKHIDAYILNAGGKLSVLSLGNIYPTAQPKYSWWDLLDSAALLVRQGAGRRLQCPKSVDFLLPQASLVHHTFPKRSVCSDLPKHWWSCSLGSAYGDTWLCPSQGFPRPPSHLNFPASPRSKVAVICPSQHWD